MKHLFSKIYFATEHFKMWLVKLVKVPYYYVLFKIYPFLNPLQNIKTKGFHLCFYTYSLLDCMPSGWNKAFGLQMAKEIKQWLKEHNITDYEVTDVKEKFGRLRWYDNGPTQLYGDVIVKYEIQSANTCVRCGSSDVTHVSKGYMLPFCEYCMKKEKDIRNFIELTKDDSKK